MVLKLMLTALYNAALAIVIYIAEKKTPFGSLSYKKKQCSIGIMFGIMAAFASMNLAGFDIGDGTIMNVRDAAPLCAGLIFGAPAGIISGIIGGIYRYISAFYGITGAYTQLACSLSTFFAGCIAALLRKFMFDDKKPGWIYGFGIGILCEVIHMLMIFFTNKNDPSTAFGVVKICCIPMMLYNGASVAAAILIISLIAKEKAVKRTGGKHISGTFQMWLFICIVIAYVLTSGYTYFLQSRMSDTETESIIKTNISDVNCDILDASDENLIEKAKNVKAEYLLLSDKSESSLKSLAEKYGVEELHIIDADGIVKKSNNTQYIGFDMSSGEQSKDFLTHMWSGDQSYAQKYQTQTFGEGISRKYAAVALDGKEFLQVGYNTEEFLADIRDTVVKIARNRHIGNNGFIVIFDENQNIVSECSEELRQKLENTDIGLDTEHKSQDELFNINIGGTAYIASYSYVEGFYIFGAIPKSEALFMRDVSVYLSSFMEILIFSALFILVYFLIKKIIIDNLMEVNHALSKITDGNLDVTVDVRTNEEFASLSDDINSTVETLKRYICEAEARIDAELEFAKQIQCSAIPSVFPPYPNRKEFDIYAQMDTAKEVGGDFYDFYMPDDNTIAFLIADVSGKGIPAAMFMMKAKTIIKDLAESGLEVNEIFTEANNKLCENNDAGMFVTAWMAIADLKTGIISIANAGHNPPIIKRSDGNFVCERQKAGFVLAGMEGIKYKKTEIQLMPGDKIYLYTDGVTEANDLDGQLYGEKRLVEFLNSINDKDVETICRAVKKDIDRFVGSAPQFDDITMVGFRLNFIKGDDRIIFIPNKDAGIAVNDFAHQLTEKLGVLPKISSKVSIAIDEIASNVINYSGAKIAEISYSIKNNRLILTFKDNGSPYNPLEAEEPDITLSAQERKIGGLGIFMVKKMTESMDYKYENNENILSITLALNL